MINPNPRIGVLLDHGKASPELVIRFARFRKRGLKWLQKHWPEERMRRELRGFGESHSREWNEILAQRGQIRK